MTTPHASNKRPYAVFASRFRSFSRLISCKSANNVRFTISNASTSALISMMRFARPSWKTGSRNPLAIRPSTPPPLFAPLSLVSRAISRLSVSISFLRSTMVSTL